jgi:hypothetical protein
MVLIFLGGVFLLQNIGWLPANAWANLWRLWPLILVLAGLELMFGGRVPAVVLAAIALFAVALALVAVTPSVPFMATPSTATVARTFETPTNGASQASVTIHYGGGRLGVGPLVDGAPSALASMRYDGPQGAAPEPQYTVRDGIGQLEYTAAGRTGVAFGPFGGAGSPSGSMDVNLSTAVPITSLSVQTGATDAHMDLSELRLGNLQVALGAASAWIRLPATGVTTARVNGGAATITLEIPQGVAAQIRQRGGLSTFNLDQSRFPPAGEGVYRSADYDSAANRVDLEIETGVTSIQVQ